MQLHTCSVPNVSCCGQARDQHQHTLHHAKLSLKAGQSLLQRCSGVGQVVCSSRSQLQDSVLSVQADGDICPIKQHDLMCPP